MSYSTCSRPQPFWGPSAGLSSVCQYPSCLVLVQSQTRHSSPDVVSQVTKRSLPQPAGYSFANTVQYALVLHCCKGTFGPPPRPPDIFCKAAFYPVSTQPFLHEFITFQVEDPVFSSVELHKVSISTFIKPSEWQPCPVVYWLQHIGVVSRPDEDAFHSTTQTLMKTLNCSDPSIEPWRMVLITSPQLNFKLLTTALWAQWSSCPIVQLSCPYLSILATQMLWKTTLKASVKPRREIFSTLLSFSNLVISLWKAILLVRHD